jgi:serine/threonine protein kinase
MSPEQAKGRNVDRRSDIWSFGVVVFEMLAGKKLFSGETATETMAQVMMKEVDFAALPADTPPNLRYLLRRCLVKDPRNRLQAIGEARIIMDAPPMEVTTLVLRFNVYPPAGQPFTAVGRSPELPTRLV